MKLEELLAEVERLKAERGLSVVDKTERYTHLLYTSDDLGRRLKLAVEAMKRIWNESEKYPIPLANFASETVDKALRDIGSSP